MILTLLLMSCNNTSPTSEISPSPMTPTHVDQVSGAEPYPTSNVHAEPIALPTIRAYAEPTPLPTAIYPTQPASNFALRLAYGSCGPATRVLDTFTQILQQQSHDDTEPITITLTLSTDEMRAVRR